MILAMALASPHSHMYLEHHQKFNVDVTYVGHLTTERFKKLHILLCPTWE
jgi:hypothetical protein